MWAVLLVACAVLGSGCATYSARTADLRPRLVAGEFDAALETIDKGTGSHDRLLTLLEKGLVLHYADRWTESNEAFASAEVLAEDLYTRSISQGLVSLVTSDEAIDYRAQPWELALVPYFKALNYQYLGQPREAAVEARRAGEMQAAAVEATLAELRPEDRADLDRIRTDPFLLWFSGMLLEQVHETNDAFVAYRNAAAAWQDLHALLDEDIPPVLAGDLARVARRLGLDEDLATARKEYPAVFAAPPPLPVDPDGEAGHVVILLETGFVPARRQVRFDFPVFSGEPYRDAESWSWSLYGQRGHYHEWAAGRKVEYWVSVAAPELEAPPVDPVSACRVGTRGGDEIATAAVAANLSRRARITFAAERPTIFFKTILRGLTKYLATRGSRKKGGEVAGILANLLGAATEKADTRGWSTLPGRILVARLDLPPGRHDLEVALLDGQGRTRGHRTIAGVTVQSGGWSFVSRRIF